jgi:opacity protein-like surface antigen
MKLAWLGLAATVAFAPSSAFAQSPVVDWSGLSATLSVGGVWGNSTQRDDGVPRCFGLPVGGSSGGNSCAGLPVGPNPGEIPPARSDAEVPPARAADGDYKVSGFALGLGFGYNWQVGSLVIGAEADISKTWVNGRSSKCGIGMPAHDCGTGMDAMATFRGRLGYAFDRYLVYVTGGGAAAQVSAYDKLFNVSGKQMMWGVSYGAGFEAMLAQNLSMKVEYLRADFGEKAVFDIVAGVPERVGLQANIVRAGVTYHFNMPALTR